MASSTSGTMCIIRDLWITSCTGSVVPATSMCLGLFIERCCWHTRGCNFGTFPFTRLLCPREVLPAPLVKITHPAFVVLPSVWHTSLRVVVQVQGKSHATRLGLPVWAPLTVALLCRSALRQSAIRDCPRRALLWSCAALVAVPPWAHRSPAPLGLSGECRTSLCIGLLWHNMSINRQAQVSNIPT